MTTRVFCLYSVLYWTEWNNASPGIYRSSVVSPAREAVVIANNPDSLAIDFAGNCLANTGTCIGVTLIPVLRY